MIPKHRYNVKPENQDVDFSISYQSIFDSTPIAQTSDLRHGFPRAFDQAQEGSCTAHGWMGLFGFYQLMGIRQNVPNLEVYEFEANKYVPGSRQACYYWERAHEGNVNEDAGAMVSTGAWVLANVGCCDENLWPYTSSDMYINPSQACYDEAAKHKIPYAYTLNGQLDILHCLSAGFPVVCGIPVYEEMESQQVAETGIVPDPTRHSQLLGYHCVDIVGHDLSTHQYWIRNSWSYRWGKNGYCLMSMNYLSRFGMQFMTLRK